jgi:integrase
MRALPRARREGRRCSGVVCDLSRAAIARSKIAGLPVTELRPEHVEQYAGWRRTHRWRGVRTRGAKRTDPNEVVAVKDEPVSNASVNRDLALLAAAINRLVRLDLLAKNPVGRVRRGKEPSKARAIFSKDECAAFLAACDPHLRLFALAMLTCGARPSELRAVTWGDVSLGNRTLTIYRSKVRVGDAIPMHSALAAELDAVRKRRADARGRKVPDDERVFLSSRGQADWDHRWAWKKALKRAGLHRRKGLTLYSLRHSFATHYLEHGSPSDLQALMGHASYATTARYARAVSERARKGIEGLDVLGRV